MKSRAAGVAGVALAAITWGTWSLFLRPAGLSPWIASPIVFAVIGVLGLALAGTEGVAARYDRRTLWLLLLYTFCNVANVVTFFRAIELTTIAVATLTHYLTPVLVALAAPFVEGRRVRGARRAAILALVGLVFVIAPWEPGRLAGNVPLGALFGATSAVAYATNVFVVGRLAPSLGTARMLGLNGVLGALLLAPFALLAPPSHPTLAALGLIALGGALPGTLAGWLFTRGLQLIGTARASVLAYIEPVVAVIVGALAFGEPITAWALLGGALILGGGLLVTLPREATAEISG